MPGKKRSKPAFIAELGALLLAVLILLTGCRPAALSFYFSGNDDPLDLRQIQGAIYEQQFAQNQQDQADGADDNTIIIDVSEIPASSGSSVTNSALVDGSTSYDSSLSEDTASATDTNQSENQDPEETSESGSESEDTLPAEPEENALFYDEAYMEEYYAMGAAILDEVGWDLRAAYDWCAEIEYFNGTPIDAGLGTIWYANLGFDTQEGNCYTYAATMTVLARLLGYEARQVDGHILDYEYLNHSWCEIVMDGETYIIDPEFEWQKGMDGFLKKYDDEGIWPLNTELIEYMEDEPQPESMEIIVEKGWPAEPPFTDFVDYLEYLQYLDRQENAEEETDPNTGCVSDDVPVQ